MLTAPAHTRGAVSRARMTASMQHSVGNARVSLALAPNAPRTWAAPSNVPSASTSPATIQRECVCAGAGAGGECGECQAKRQIAQRQVTDADAGSSLPLSVREVMQSGGGEPLPVATRRQMEGALDAPLGGVRIHTGPQAGRAARDVNAQAFTVGQDIYFGEGQYQPDTPRGQHLLAHELTHTIQQTNGRSALQPADVISQPGDPLEREAEAVANRVSNDLAVSMGVGATAKTGAQRHVARQAQGDAATAVNAAVDEAVKAIIEDLSGVTTRWASARILAQFEKQSGMARAIMQGLKNQAGAQGMSAEGMIDWLFGDMTAEDSRALRRFLIKNGVVEDLARITANQVKEYVDDEDSPEIYTALAEFGGPQLEVVIKQLQTVAGKGTAEMPEWLFDDMERLDAERLRQHFFANGGPNAVLYAAVWTASKINSLLGGYVSHADSTSIVWNFQTTPEGYRGLVQASLSDLMGGKRLDEAMMESMDQLDYEAVRMMGGVKLGTYVDKRSWLKKVASVTEWGTVVELWIACGIIGVVTGILSAAWDIIKGFWDIGVAVWHLIWSLVYLVSGGSAGSENWLAVKEFFGGLADTVGSPGKAWDQYLENLKLEFKTIEGPLTDCRQAEFIVRKFITAVVNIVLIVVAGYGLAKIAVSAVTGVAELAALARQVGVLRALVQTGVKTGRAARKLVAVVVTEAGRIAKALLTPIQTLINVGRTINVIFIAIQEEGIWTSLRKQAGGLVEGEKKFWQEKKESWKSLGEKRQTRHAELSDEAVSLQESLNEKKAPEQPDKVVEGLANDAKKLEDEVDDLYKEVTGPQKKPESEQPPAKVVQQPAQGGAQGKILWVEENASMSSEAEAYQASAPGARPGQAPQLTYVDEAGQIKKVRYDGIDGDVMIDRKVKVTTFPKSKDQALRQSLALKQNGLTGRWEVPTQTEANRATKMLENLGITNINVKVVPK